MPTVTADVVADVADRLFAAIESGEPCGGRGPLG